MLVGLRPMHDAPEHEPGTHRSVRVALAFLLVGLVLGAGAALAATRAATLLGCDASRYVFADLPRREPAVFPAPLPFESAPPRAAHAELAVRPSKLRWKAKASAVPRDRRQ